MIHAPSLALWVTEPPQLLYPARWYPADRVAGSRLSMPHVAPVHPELHEQAPPLVHTPFNSQSNLDAHLKDVDGDVLDNAIDWPAASTRFQGDASASETTRFSASSAHASAAGDGPKPPLNRQPPQTGVEVLG